VSLYQLWLRQRLLGTFVAAVTVVAVVLGVRRNYPLHFVIATGVVWGFAAFWLFWPFDSAPERPRRGVRVDDAPAEPASALPDDTAGETREPKSSRGEGER
jgi:hypothetical protein